MTGNTIRLPDIDGNMHHYHFCPSCYYLLFGEDIGANYCPHCGTQLFCESKKATDYHKINFDYSIEYYERLKNGK